jgi:signal transduction histidine kinase
LGLGLTVARRLTDFLGGTLDLKSQPGVGTQVQLSLPYRAASRRSDTAESRV